MVQSQRSCTGAAVLAGITIPSKDLPPIKGHFGSGAFDHIPQPYDRWALKGTGNRLNIAASITDQTGFSSQD
jgi:hypothetical protein